MSNYNKFIAALNKQCFTVNISVASNNYDLEESEIITINELPEAVVEEMISNQPFRLEFIATLFFDFKFPDLPIFLKKAHSVAFISRDYSSLDITYHQFIEVSELKIDLYFVDSIKFQEFKQLKQLYLRRFLLNENTLSLSNNSLEHLILSREEYNSELSSPLKILDITGTPNLRKLDMYSIFNETVDKEIKSDIVLAELTDIFINCCDISNKELSFLNKCTSVKSFTLKDSGYFYPIECFACPEILEELIISPCIGFDYLYFSSFTNLKELTLFNCNKEMIRLDSMVFNTVTKLVINNAVIEESDIFNLVNLSELIFRDSIVNLTHINSYNTTNLLSLEVLKIINTSGIENESILFTKCKGLKKISLSMSERLNSIMPFIENKYLEEININNNSNFNLEQLKNFKNLKKISIYYGILLNGNATCNDCSLLEEILLNNVAIDCIEFLKNIKLKKLTLIACNLMPKHINELNTFFINNPDILNIETDELPL